jgi:hypothetical protein
MNNSEIDIVVRAFGMSGLQATTDLQQVQETLSQSILSNADTDAKRKLEGYDQFEKEVRRQASEMSEYYEIFYCLEASIRQLVDNILSDPEVEGADWWHSDKVPDGFRTEVTNLKRKDGDSGMSARSDSELDYLTFGQLGQLITSNYEHFGGVLSSKAAVSRIMNQLNMLRNPIAHCCLLAEDEKERLELTVRDWFRLRS